MPPIANGADCPPMYVPVEHAEAATPAFVTAVVIVGVVVMLANCEAMHVSPTDAHLSMHS